MECQTCQKPQRLCLCGLIKPQENQTEILILQHPQEPDHLLGTARMAHLALKNSLLKIGLSWPNLKAALGKPANPSHWVVLYLGSGLKEEKAEAALQLLSKKKQTYPSTHQNRRCDPSRRHLEPSKDTVVAQPVASQSESSHTYAFKTVTLQRPAKRTAARVLVHN